MAAVPAELYKSLRTSIEMRIYVWWVSGLVLPAAIISCNQCPKINMTADCAHHSHSNLVDLYFSSVATRSYLPKIMLSIRHRFTTTICHQKLGGNHNRHENFQIKKIKTAFLKFHYNISAPALLDKALAGTTSLLTTLALLQHRE